MIIRHLGIACLLCVITACSTDDSQPADAGNDTTTADTSSDVTRVDVGDVSEVEPTLSAVSSLIFTPSCAIEGCHVSTSRDVNGFDLREGPDLMDRLRADSSLGYPYIADSLRDSHLYLLITGRETEIFGTPGTMPQAEDGGPLPDDQIDLIRRWIEAGAPE